MEQKIAEPICDYLCHGEGEKPCAKYGTALCHLDNAIKKQLALIAEDRAGLETEIKTLEGIVKRMGEDAAIEGRK